MIIKAHHCSQYRRYVSNFGELAISRRFAGICSVIPRHTPHVSIKIQRTEAAECLRIWRNY